MNSKTFLSWKVYEFLPLSTTRTLWILRLNEKRRSLWIHTLYKKESLWILSLSTTRSLWILRLTRRREELSTLLFPVPSRRVARTEPKMTVAWSLTSRRIEETNDGMNSVFLHNMSLRKTQGWNKKTCKIPTNSRANQLVPRRKVDQLHDGSTR